MLAPVAWRTPPRHYGPWESIASLLTEELVRNDIDVTLFASGDSVTTARLDSVVEQGYEENREIDAKVAEYLHIANCFEKAGTFDLIHNHFDFPPLTYSAFVNTPVLTTIHGFSSKKILPVYEKYNTSTYYVSISNADRAENLTYVKTIYHGIDISKFAFNPEPQNYLLFFGRIHPDKGTREAIEIAAQSGVRLLIAGIIQDKQYFFDEIAPKLDNKNVAFLGSIGPDKRDKLLGNARALLHPIHFNEPFGLSVVEAMACGTPTIAFSRGSMPELISSGNDGFLVDTVEEAANCVGWISSIERHRCRRTAEQRFSVGRMAQEYLEVYKKIVESKSSLGHEGAW